MRLGGPRVVALALLFPATLALAEGTPDPVDPVVQVDLQGGQRLYGRIRSTEAESLVLDLVGGGQVVVARGSVERIEPVRRPPRVAGGRLRFPSALDTRYLHAQSASLPGGGQGYVAQEAFALTTGVVGLGDHLAVGAGGVVPVWFSGEDGLNGWAMAKAGLELGPHFRLAAHAEALSFPILGRVALADLILTFETERLSLTVGAGRAAKFHDGRLHASDDVAYAAGAWRLTADVSVVAESWFLAYWPDWDLLGAGGVRLAAHPYALDVGVLLVPFTRLPIPWINVGWAF